MNKVKSHLSCDQPVFRDLKQAKKFHISWFEMKQLTCVDESSWCAFAKLFGLVGQRDLYHPGDVTRRGLNSDGMRCDELWGENQKEDVRTKEVYDISRESYPLAFPFPSMEVARLPQEVWELKSAIFAHGHSVMQPGCLLEL